MALTTGRSLRCMLLCLLLGCGSSGSGDKEAPAASKAQASAGDDDYKDYPDPRGACKIDSGYPDDHACILPPAKSEGIQIHVGPRNYDDKDEVAKFLLHPGEETSQCWTFHTPNDQEFYYQTSVLSGRAGTHHIINTMLTDDMDDGGWGRCADGGTGTASNILGPLPGASKAYMARGHVAPENKHIGRKIPGHTTAQADMHYFNYTDHDILREFWMNIYFVDASQITDDAQQIRGMGGFDWSTNPIPPGHDEVYKYECPIKGNGRILNLLGHYHSHGKHFSASLQRGGKGEPEKVFEMYDYMDPATFEFDSRSMNPDFSDAAAGAFTGVLEVHDGDVLGWECHIINDSDVGLRYVNEVKTGEMCNLWGTSFGIDAFNCLKR
jgi:hypothetical protein